MCFMVLNLKIFEEKKWPLLIYKQFRKILKTKKCIQLNQINDIEKIINKTGLISYLQFLHHENK